MSPKKDLKEINVDLAKERQKCNLNIEEVTNIIDGGKEKTLQRRKIENIALNSGASRDKIPEECLGPVEKYENAVRKSCLFSKIVKEEVLSFTGLETFGYCYNVN
uniref:Acyl-coenzyme A oxidase N-terminal domain-containing protein n=1 Tax=Pectinophora gossypiella TaxID=13191 RepID=A0A1E1W1J6_PECGO